jgi:hypothetical protein
MASRVDWSRPAGRPDVVFGTGARPAERSLASSVALAATAVMLSAAALDRSTGWAAWQYVMAALVVFDLAGGVVANGLNSAKRDHFAVDSQLEGSWSGRLVRRPWLFAALHLHPVAVGASFAGGAWWWGLCWYATTLATVVLVSRVPLYLARPVALAACVLTVLVSPLTPAPDGFAWLPTVMVLKLTLAHAVPEEPYRPVG